MDDLYLDLETFGTTPLRSHGAHRYAQDAEVMLIALAWDATVPRVIDSTDDNDKPRLFDELRYAIKHARTVVTHGTFDRIVLGNMPGHEPVIIPPEKQEDTMVVALQHSLPGGLDALCGILGVPFDEAKDKDGKRLINLFCSPTPKNWKIRRATKHTHAADWARFVDYAGNDITAMRSVRQRLPRWNCTPLERQYWLHDQASNALGMQVDLDHAACAVRAYDEVKRAAKDEAVLLTGGLLGSVSQRDKLLGILRDEYGWKEENMTKATLEKVLRGTIDPGMRALLELRLKASAASPAKYKALMRATGSDGRLRDTLQFCGAGRTGRDAGRIFQPQNLPRPSLSREAIEVGIEALKLGCADMLFDVTELVVSSVRSTVTARPGHKLLVADLSNIEGRVLAWGAGEQWKIDAFRANDAGTGAEIYILTAAGILGIPLADVTKEQRDKMGKVPELACGYQGSLGAFRRMGGVKVEGMRDEEIYTIVGGWRTRHPMTQKLWYNLEDTARAAIGDPGKTFIYRGVAFDMATGPDGSSFLRMRLPSGRFLSYLGPTGGYTKCVACDGKGVIRPDPDSPYDVCPECKGEAGSGSEALQYQGVNQTNHQWETIDTYGGKITENWTQAVARDVFFHGYHLAVQRGFRIVLRVHDELVAEVPMDSHLTLADLIECMTTNPIWAPGLPLAAKGFETIHYYKD